MGALVKQYYDDPALANHLGKRILGHALLEEAEAWRADLIVATARPRDREWCGQ